MKFVQLRELWWKLRRKAWTRRAFFLIFDVTALSISMALSFGLRFDGNPSELSQYFSISAIILLAVLLFKLPIFYLFKLYDISLSFASIRDAIYIAIANLVASMSLYSGYEFISRTTHFPVLPRSVAIIDFLLSLIFVALIRFSKRTASFALKSLFSYRNGKRLRKLLVVGAGNAGEQLIRSLIKEKEKFKIVGVLDDNPSKWGTYLHGIKVYGGRKLIPYLVDKFDVDSVIIAIPSASSADVKEFIKLSRSSGVKDIKILPSISELVNGTVSVKDLRDISLDDLLGRAQVKIEFDKVSDFIKGRTILVTGSSGSIGQELCRQIAKFHPHKLLLFEIDETRLFDTHRELVTRYPNVEFKPVLGDVRDRNKVSYVFERYQPDIVFHAAAYKHVPMMEAFPEEAVKTNIIGTYNVGLAAVQYGTDKFVFISTDKAVNPTSVMGATKRVGEMIALSFNNISNTKFIAVRFGNVLGSRGSVIPIFREQIMRGGPVTVTHPEMRRYFMTIPEAVLLVLQASAMGDGGEVFVLDMGEPIKIVDIARELISLMGYEPDKDIPIVFTGIRPGEKLFEELLTAEEGTYATHHEKIFRARLSRMVDMETLSDYIEEMEQLSAEMNRKTIVLKLKEMVPTYNPNSSLYAEWVNSEAKVSEG